MMNEEATIKAAKIAADAAIEAAQITAKATTDAGVMALVGGLFATLAAAGVAFLVGRKQADIQKRLANIELTRVNFDLVERRTAYFAIIEEFTDLMIRIDQDAGDLPRDVEKIVSVATELERASHVARFFYSAGTEDTLAATILLCRDVKSFFEDGVSSLATDFRGSDEFKDIEERTGRLWDRARLLLPSQSKHFVEELLDNEIPAKSSRNSLAAIFGIS